LHCNSVGGSTATFILLFYCYYLLVVIYCPFALQNVLLRSLEFVMIFGKFCVLYKSVPLNTTINLIELDHVKKVSVYVFKCYRLARLPNALTRQREQTDCCQREWMCVVVDEQANLTLAKRPPLRTGTDRREGTMPPLESLVLWEAWQAHCHDYAADCRADRSTTQDQ